MLFPTAVAVGTLLLEKNTLLLCVHGDSRGKSMSCNSTFLKITFLVIL